ncbi:MAG: hypothetical protein WD894_02210 [Pirellulales bacterium]
MNRRTNQVLLTAVFVLLVAHLFRSAPAVDIAGAKEAGNPPEVIRAQGFELVNKQGKVVAQLYIGEQGGGNIRLRSADGTIRVKLGANDEGSSLLLCDDRAEPAVRLASDKTGTSATLAEKGKEKKVLKP